MIISGITGATAINPALVEIKPSDGTDDLVLKFDVTQTADTGSVLEAIFTYAISGPAPFITDMTTLSNSSETVDGDVSETQNYCVGGQFGPDGVDGGTGLTSGTLLTLDGIQNTDQGSFAGATTLGITDDFVLDGGRRDRLAEERSSIGSPLPQPFPNPTAFSCCQRSRLYPRAFGNCVPCIEIRK